MLERLPILKEALSAYQQVIFFDTETTGLQYEQDQIIELAYIVIKKSPEGVIYVSDSYDGFIRLESGRCLAPKITELTGITESDLENGYSEKEVLSRFNNLLTEKTLLAAHNAHFDVRFLEEGLKRYGLSINKGVDYLDTLTVFKDRAAYPHRLCNAISYYELEDVKNSHRAIDDCYALAEVFLSLIEERNDVLQYVNIFGVNPRYGVSGGKISKVTYLEQPYNNYMVPQNKILPCRK